MRIIAHRGNLHGPSGEENDPKQIVKCIEQGYDVEIDLRAGVGLWLGHDYAEYEIQLGFLEKYKDKLWVHCKNEHALWWCQREHVELNYFWHQEDDYTVTSKGWIWAYPDKMLLEGERTVCVMPELYNSDVTNATAICTDYAYDYKTNPVRSRRCID